MFHIHTKKQMAWTALIGVVCLALLAACVQAGIALILRSYYEFRGPITADTTLYMAVGRGLLNGLVPYADLFENKPLGIFLLSSVSLFFFGDQTIASVLEAIIVLSFPCALVTMAWLETKHLPRVRRSILLALSFLFGALLGLYTAERSGEFQVESFGAFFGLLYLITIARHMKNMGRVRTGVAALFLLCSIGMKEPFLLTTCAGAIFLCHGNFRSLWRIFGIPVVLASFLGVTFLAAMGYLVPYVTIYLHEMFGIHIYGSGSPWRRGLDWQIVFRDVLDYQPVFAYLILLFLGYFLWRGMRQKNIAHASVQILSALLGTYLLTCAVGMGGAYWNHHFVFAVPGYTALFLVYLREHAHFSFSWFEKIFLSLVALLLMISVWGVPSSDYDHRIQDMEKDSVSARATAEQIDRILSGCDLSQYLFIGGNGLQPYAYTTHSPMGPNFFQYDYLLNHERPLFRETFLENMRRTRIIVFQSYQIDDLKDDTKKYISEHFTRQPWHCAAHPSAPDGYTFYFRHSNQPQQG